LALRLLQVHTAVVLVTSGLHKLQFADWWNGLALWYRLHPPFQTTAETLRLTPADAAVTFTLLSVAAYLVLAWQIGFPFFAWRPRWRLVLLGGAVLGWLGTAFLYRIPGFGPALMVLCLAYLTAAEWRRVAGFVAALPGLRGLAVRLPGRAQETVVRGPRGEMGLASKL
jgi:hypothetical protein